MDVYLLTPPTAEPVSIADARTAARLEEGAHWDDILAGAIPAARAVAEHQTGRHFMAQTWRVELADWPTLTQVLPCYRPTALAVSWWSGTVWVDLDGSAYAWHASGTGFVMAPALGTSWPSLGQVAVGPRVRVDVTVGEADAATVPPEVAQFIKAIVTLMVHDPSLTATEALAANAQLMHMLDPARLFR